MSGSKKISQLPAITEVVDSDMLPVVDATDSITKKATMAQIRALGQGATGATGPQGSAGVQGATGSQGPTGVQGATGPAGATGAQGVQGIQGIQGATGAQGTAGSAGATGSTGPTGNEGAMGPTGPQGTQGPQGATGPQGDAGTPGTPGAVGATGATGVAGNNGAVGATGATGASFVWENAWQLATAYTVNDVVIHNGSSYVCILNNTSASTDEPGVGVSWATYWNLMVQMGATGAAGVQGDTGATGPLGATGPAGDTGPQGATGAIGSIKGQLDVTIDGGGAVITTGVKTSIRVPFDATIIGWEIVSADPATTSGSIILDLYQDEYANYPATVADTITGTEKPTISSATKGQDLAVSTWTNFIEGEWVTVNVDSVTDLLKVVLTVYYTRAE